jgi:subtilisin family serine protease
MRTCSGGPNSRLPATSRSLHPLLLVSCCFVAFFAAAHFSTEAAFPSPSLSFNNEVEATPDAQVVGDASGVLPTRTELLERLGVRAWYAHGWRGQGVKIAILDSGFSGYQAHLGRALPRSVKVRSFRFDGNLEAKDSQHGILCAEVIHTIAPEAELLLANWEPERPDQFLRAIRWARQQGARIVSCSIIMPTWSDCEGHGRIHEELTRLLGTDDESGDALFFASAGNTAQRHWSGPFQDGGDGYHVWRDSDGRVRSENSIRPWGSERVSVELCCPVGNVYELLVFDTTQPKLVGRAFSAEAAGVGSAVVAFVPETYHAYCTRVRRVRSEPGDFHLVVLGGGLAHASSAGSIPFPGDGSEVIAVGAVDASGRRLAYSSCGLRRGEIKPNLVATVPFPSCWRPRPFAGTSAAAPQACALAALLWSRHANWNAEQIRTALQKAATPGPANTSRWETGHGLLRLPPAAPARKTLTLSP